MEHIAVHLIELLKDPTCLAHVLEQDGAEIQIAAFGMIILNVYIVKDAIITPYLVRKHFACFLSGYHIYPYKHLGYGTTSN